MNRILACVLTALLVAAPSRAADNFSRGLSMAQGMMNMMDGMGMFGAASQGAQGLGSLPGQAWNPMSQGATGVPMPTLETLPREAGRMADQAWQGMSRVPGQLPGASGQSAAGRLDGTWQSNSGERLWIGNGRFRLDSGPERRAEGLIQLRDRLVGLYIPEQKRSLLYEYAEYEGRLALRDAEGRLFLYRRIPAGAGQGGSGAAVR